MSFRLLPLLSDPYESPDSSSDDDSSSEGDIEDSVEESDDEESDEDDEELALELLDGSEVGLDLLLERPTFLSALPR